MRGEIFYVERIMTYEKNTDYYCYIYAYDSH